jgi:hypothetical protein
MRNRDVTRVFAAIWITAIGVATAFIVLVISTWNETAQHYPSGLPPIPDAQIVFIGSSLTAFALPIKEPAEGVLADGRSCAMLSLPGISERLSTRLLAHALESGAETVFLEINAYAHEYVDEAEPAIGRWIVNGMRDAGARLAISVKSLFKSAPKPNYVVKCRGGNANRTLDTAKLLPRDFYRFQTTEPSRPDELEALITRAREAGVEVIFFSPPRPRVLVDKLGDEDFAEFLAHLDHVAASQGVPLWYSPAPWPDDHFMDILAHANERGRHRFRQDLIQWYEGRR